MKRIILALAALALLASPAHAQNYQSQPTGQQNNDHLIIGYGAGNPLMTGQGNTAIGVQAGSALTIPNAGAGCVAPSCIQQDTFLGYQAGMSATTARESTCIGFEACWQLTGQNNGIEDSIFTAVGSYALQTCSNACADIVAVGQKAAESVSSGGSSIFIGNHAGVALTTVSNDTYVGNFAGGNATTTGGFNTILGAYAAQYLQGTAAFNVWLGYQAGVATAGNPNTGQLNTGVGYDVGESVTSAGQLALLGYQAGKNITTGSGNVAIGYQALQADVSGAGNIAIGQQAGNAITGAHNILIGTDAGNNAPAASNNLLVMGGDGSGGAEKITDGYFGKGYATATPTDFTFHATGGSGTDIAGANLIVGGGQGTGAGAGGQVKIAYAAAGTTGTSLNALANAMLIGPGVQIGAPTGGDKGAGTLNISGAIWANGTVGVSCSGTPTSSFASVGGVVTHC